MQIKNLNKSFSELVIFNNFNMSIQEGKINCILGPSGCGKTTLLNIIAGLENIDSGELIGFDKKTISYIFQEPRLLDWMTVYENIEFILKDIYNKNERKKIVNSYINTVSLSEFQNYYPKNLSGGMKQRVSIARAFAYPSNLLIMDEPFKGLDSKLKTSLINEFLKLWYKDKKTVLFVTHDIDEAILLGDFIYILNSNPAVMQNKLSISLPQENRNIDIPELVGIKNKLINSY